MSSGPIAITPHANRPDLVPGRTADDITKGLISGYFDRTAFAAPAFGTFGNLGRNVLRGPGYVNLDFSMNKETKINEDLTIQFRAETFNTLNHPNYALPATGVFTLSGGNTAYNPTAGRITATAAAARQIQFALKFIF